VQRAAVRTEHFPDLRGVAAARLHLPQSRLLEMLTGPLLALWTSNRGNGVIPAQMHKGECQVMYQEGFVQ
jgi:hypothetical protein